MIGRRSVLALAVLCALAISAVSVASASATEAVTCVKEGTALRGAHCLETGTAAKEWSHKTFTGETSITGTNANTATETTAAAPTVLAGKLSGVVTELQCTTTSGTGTMKNTGTQAAGTGTIKYTGCTVLKPSGKGCVVNAGTVETNELAAESEGKTVLKFAPKTGETFANIKIESCSVSALNATFPVTGKVKGTVTGATTTTTEAGVTTQATLFFGGNPAGLEGALTIKGTNALALT